jgi:hypothetical protein
VALGAVTDVGIGVEVVAAAKVGAGILTGGGAAAGLGEKRFAMYRVAVSKAP